MDRERWVTNFGCEHGCYGTGFLVVWKRGKSQEAKCLCDHWRHQEKADRIKSLKEMEAEGWSLNR